MAIEWNSELAMSDRPGICMQDRSRMYTIGSLFYAIYFFVSFPAFYVMDESVRKWSLVRAVTDSLAAGMLVTILLDLWRLGIGPLEKVSSKTPTIFSGEGPLKLPWLG